jgi:hypothetical protein
MVVPRGLLSGRSGVRVREGMGAVEEGGVGIGGVGAMMRAV